jgi:hypothetical protein
VQPLARQAVVRLPRHLAHERAVRGDVGDPVGDQALDQLELDDRPTELRASGGPVGRRAQGALGRAGRAGGDHQPLLDKPAARKLVAAAHLAEHGLLADHDVLQAELGVLVDEGVHVARRAQHAHPRRVLVDQKQGGRALRQHQREHN